MTALLNVSALDAFYGDFQALFGIDFELKEGEAVAVIGANGAGKSTMLKSLAGLVKNRPDAIHLKGRAIGDASAASIVRLGLALVPEGRQLFPSLSVEENLLIGAYGGERTAPWDLAAVYRIFPVLRERRRGAVTALSGGQQQMLVIGRALMAAPRIMAIDEPSLGLAPKIIDQVYEILLRLRALRKLTLLIVEQSSTRAMMTGGRMVLIRGGRIVLEGPAADLVRDDRLKQSYFGFGDH